MQDVSDSPPQITVALADSNPLVLTAMSELFDNDPRFSLISTTGTAEGFLGTAIRVPVQVGVIDWNLPALGGQRLIEILREQADAPRIVIYGDDTSDLPRQAMTSGAAAFSPRNGPVEGLLETVASVAAGKMVFPFLDVRQLQTNPIQLLTKRERALLEALSTGLSNRQLATQFGISANTVKFHLSNLYEKIEVTSRTQAVAFYYSARAQIAPPPRPKLIIPICSDNIRQEFGG